MFPHKLTELSGLLAFLLVPQIFGAQLDCTSSATTLQKICYAYEAVSRKSETSSYNVSSSCCSEVCRSLQDVGGERDQREADHRYVKDGCKAVR